jgi:hypothetical protein
MYLAGWQERAAAGSGDEKEPMTSDNRAIRHLSTSRRPYNNLGLA